MKPYKLLCVDDDALFRELYKNLFGSLGYEVTVAGDGQHALALLRLRHVDAVLTDFTMPGMNGQELAIRLKQREPHLPVILLTGEKRFPRSSRKAADICLEKGISVNELAEKLENLLAVRPAPPPASFLPLGSALATIAVGAYLLPRILD